MELRSVAALIEASRKMPIWEAILCSDLEEDTPEQRAASLEKMQMLWQVMQDSAAGYDGSQRSLSGLSGGDGEKYTQMLSSGKMMCGTYLNDAIATALKQRVQCLYETHCGSTYCRSGDSGGADSLPERIPRYTGWRCSTPSTTAAGNIIAERASVSGAEAGCQAEIGAASAMAAAALVYLRGGSPEACGNACAMALKNLLGLVCDPVAGLVEVPCVKRNVVGVVNAISCANMALAGIVSRIPPDEVIDAMAEVGSSISADLRE
ncbi:MAG: L-serine ammonia-lyase, iron-sulfur-dependent, subunit beta, partial [Ruminococcus callidus]